jgi:hypothetical protein
MRRGETMTAKRTPLLDALAAARSMPPAPECARVLVERNRLLRESATRVGVHGAERIGFSASLDHE